MNVLMFAFLIAGGFAEGTEDKKPIPPKTGRQRTNEDRARKRHGKRPPGKIWDANDQSLPGL
ncbi:MAG TPA: hypothetical protein VFF06_09390 [Polyangia bacterium]|nr:hypothetical protein [Polyangia bacterium]